MDELKKSQVGPSGNDSVNMLYHLSGFENVSDDDGNLIADDGNLSADDGNLSELLDEFLLNLFVLRQL